MMQVVDQPEERKMINSQDELWIQVIGKIIETALHVGGHEYPSSLHSDSGFFSRPDTRPFLLFFFWVSRRKKAKIVSAARTDSGCSS
jgi:hypothetical protein